MQLILSNPVGGTIIDAAGTGWIIDDDGGNASPTQIAINNVTVVEGPAVTADFTVTRTGDISNAATVGYVTANGSALAGPDYTQ